jgi:hypothetical protein
MATKKYVQHVLVEFNNTSPHVVKFTSNKPITMPQVVAKIEKDNEDINWDKDGVTFIDIYSEKL